MVAINKVWQNVVFFYYLGNLIDNPAYTYKFQLKTTLESNNHSTEMASFVEQIKAKIA